MGGERNYRKILALFLIAFVLVLQGCSNEYQAAVEQRYPEVKGRLDNLGKQLDNRTVVNALLIERYAKDLAERKPELKEVAQVLALDAGRKGPMYQSLAQRLNGVNRNPENRSQFIPASQELEAVWAASDPIVYNESLIDVVNTLADLSGGELSRIEIPHNTTSKSQSPPGSYLVGNPAYGSWKQGSSGKSFWEWYGQYRMFSDVANFAFGGGYRGRYYYDDWYSRPRYSYYHDYGRGMYGNQRDLDRWRNAQSRFKSKGVNPPKPKDYGSVSARKRASTYATMRSTASRNASSSSGSSGSSAKRSSSFFGGSSRGTSSGSRSRFGGK